MNATRDQVAHGFGPSVLTRDSTETDLCTYRAWVKPSSVGVGHSTTPQTLELLPRDEGRKSPVGLTNPRRRSSQRLERID